MPANQENQLSVDAPIAPSERIEMLDILRGFAVMAIFIVNIKAMVMPFSYYANGMLWATEAEQQIALWQKFLIDDRWRTIFTALFGAGLVLISDKTMAKGAASGAGRLLTRNMWLMGFGLVHLLLIWGGDILFLYGMAGMLAMWFRNMSMRTLIVWATIILIAGSVWAGMFGMAPVFVPGLGEELGGMMWGTDDAVLVEDIAAMRGSFMEQTSTRIGGAIGYIGFYMLLGGYVVVTMAIMLWGMVFYKSGLLRGDWSLKSTLSVAVICIALASAMEYYQYTYEHANQNTFIAHSQMVPLAMVDGYLGGLGFAALIASLVTMGARLRPVAAVGRMAFTNYIACSLIGTLLVTGHGLGFVTYGETSLVQAMTIVAATLVSMLIWSPLWLSMFRFGPLEWLWRSLTYGKLQPLLKRA